MGVATGGTTRRWAAALAGLTAVALAPAAYDRWPAGEADLAPRLVLARAVHSSEVPYQGLAESTGSLGLPDLPRLGDVAAMFGGTTRTRVWWRSPTAWRVDRITAIGEFGTYAVEDGVQTWDFESGSVRRAVGTTPVRLPRVDDLVPPLAVRRALAGTTPRDAVTALPSRRVAGRAADGIRVRPADRFSTVGHLDVYVDRRTGLPLSIVVVPRGSGVVAVRSAFVDIDVTMPAADEVTPKVPPFGRVRTTRTPDLAAAVDRFAPFALPGALAGLRRSPGLVGSGGGTATYGTGLARFVVLPLWPRLGRSAATAASAGGGAPLDVGSAGDAVLVGTPLLNAVVVRSTDGGWPGRSYLVAGTVLPTVLQGAAQQLLDDPPPFR
jgi:hypothetical protein